MKNKCFKPLLMLIAFALSAFATVANAQLSATATITDFGPAAPVPGTNDVAVIFQADDGLNYYDNNNPQPGQTFTTGNDPGGVYTLTGLSLKTDGGGGGGEVNSQTYTLRIFSVSGNAASLLQTYTATLSLVQSNWITWSGLSVPLAANAQYAYTIAGATGYERLASATNSPYSGGQICLIPAAGGTITFGSYGAFDAAFNVGLAIGSVAGGTVTLTQSSSTPTPGASDISQLTATPLYAIPAQTDDGLNYYFDNAKPPGATFTTGTNSTGYLLETMSIKTAGGQGGLSGSGQAYVLRIYQAASSPATLLATYTSDSSTFTFANSDWLQWTNLGGLGLLPNTKYAYTLHRVTAGWEHMANYGGNPYAGGEICLISPTAPYAITYGTAHGSDAAFVAGLQTSPGPVANQPTYAPNINPIYAGSQLTLNESALGVGPLYYEWLTDGGTGAGLAPIGGFSTNSTLAVDTTSFVPGTTYNYAVIITNAYNSVTSSVTALIVTNASSPTIITNTASPNTTTNFVGLSEIFNVSVQGTVPITYQWQVATDANGDGAANISGATNATLELDNLQLTNTGYYSVIASNSVSPFITNSAWAQLTVVPLTNQFIHWQAPVPFSGLTAGQILTNLPGYYLEAATFGGAAGPYLVNVGGTVYSFMNGGLSASITGNQGLATGAYLYSGGTNTTGDTNFDQALDNRAYNSANGIINITLHNLSVGSNYSVQLFSVDSQDSGRLVNFQDPNNAADVSTTYDAGSPGQGQNLHYIVGTFTADNTDVTIQMNLLLVITPPSGVANIDALVVRALDYQPVAAPTIYTQPVSVSSYAGRTVQFSTLAGGLPYPNWQWVAGPVGGPYTNLVDGGGISGSTNTTLIVSNVTEGMEVEFTATNSAGGTSSLPADLTLLPNPPTSGVYATNVLALHPVAYWPLNETSDPYNGGVSGVAVYDASGNNNDGLYLFNAENGFDGIVGPQPANGYPQFAAGQGAFQPQTPVPFPSSWITTPALNLNTNTVTMMMWLNPNGEQVAATGLLFNRNANTVGGMCYSTTNQLGYTWNNNDSATWGYASGPVIPTNIWSLVAMVITPTNASFYVINTNNGVTNTVFVHNHSAMAWNGSSANITIGTDTAYLARTFNGVIDEPVVFNYALTPSQLESLAGVSVAPVTNTNAVTLHFAAAVTGGAGGSAMNFSWAPDHLGWQLYTNAVGLNAAGSWFPVPGSASVTNETIGINPSNTNVFFQMRYP